MKSSETICWSCKNCTSCSWSNGKPVKGWTAKPTKIGYIVLACPQYAEDDVIYADKTTLAYILNLTPNQIINLRKRRKDILEDMLKQKGYAFSTQHNYIKKIKKDIE